METKLLNLLPDNGILYKICNFINKDIVDEYHNNILHITPWKQEPITIFGKRVMQPRLTAWYGDSGKEYSYSGITMQPLPWTEELKLIKSHAEHHAGCTFNSALLNLYRNGADSMGWHRDNEKSLGYNPVIASVSLGAKRLFKVRRYTDKKQTINIELNDNTLLIMAGNMQDVWEHSIPKTTKQTEARINITFRQIK